MEEKKPEILIVEDDLDVAEMLNAYFSVQGFEVQTANWGEDAVQASLKHTPDLVILDIRLPDIDGFEVARRLRTNRRTQNVPIIFLTEKRARSDRLHGLELGADDYVTKPFDIQELRLRVQNALSRAEIVTVTNPVTNLPEGVLLDEQLEGVIHKSQWALLLIYLENMDTFREMYGFVAADDVLKAISLMTANSIRDVGGEDDFIGQLNPSEFVVATTPGHLQPIRDRVVSRLEQSIDYFYPLRDRANIQDRRIRVRVAYLDSAHSRFDGVVVLKAALRKLLYS